MHKDTSMYMYYYILYNISNVIQVYTIYIRYYGIDVVRTNKRFAVETLIRIQHILKTNQYINGLADDKPSVEFNNNLCCCCCLVCSRAHQQLTHPSHITSHHIIVAAVILKSSDCERLQCKHILISTDYFLFLPLQLQRRCVYM